MASPSQIQARTVGFNVTTPYTNRGGHVDLPRQSAVSAKVTVTGGNIVNKGWFWNSETTQKTEGTLIFKRAGQAVLDPSCQLDVDHEVNDIGVQFFCCSSGGSEYAWGEETHFNLMDKGPYADREITQVNVTFSRNPDAGDASPLSTAAVKIDLQFDCHRHPCERVRDAAEGASDAFVAGFFYAASQARTTLGTGLSAAGTGLSAAYQSATNRLRRNAEVTDNADKPKSE